MLLSEETGHDDRTAEIAAESHCGEYHGDGIGRADGGERKIVYRPPRDHRIRHIVHLLEYDAAYQRQRIQPQQFEGIPFGEISDHECLLLSPQMV